MTLFRALGRHLAIGRARRADADHQRQPARPLRRASCATAACAGSMSRSTRSTRRSSREITRRGRLDQVLDGHRRRRSAPGSRSRSTPWRCAASTRTSSTTSSPGAVREGFDLVFIEVMPMGDIGGENRLDQYLPLSLVRARLQRRWTLDESRLPHRRPGALRDGARDRRPARLHHAADPQFLRKLQPGPADLHRHALHVPRPGGCGRSAHAAAPVGGRRGGRGGDPSRRSPASPRATTSSSTGGTTGRPSPGI